MKVDHFFCYNKKVSDYLMSKGHKLVTVAIDINTKKIYSLYVITDELTKSLAEYKQLNKNKTIK